MEISPKGVELVDSEPTAAQPSGDTVAPVSLPRKSTGPRTPAGKERSKHNATRHGIFSKVALLPKESRKEFDSLMSGLRSDLQPEGMFEDVLVDKLAVLSWRYRRLLIAETAEIQKGAAFLEWDQKERREKEATHSPNPALVDFTSDTAALNRARENPEILEECLLLLRELKKRIETNGFDYECDEAILIRLYGRGDAPTHSLLDAYRVWSRAAEASPEQAARSFLRALASEIRWLAWYKEERASIEAERMRLESLRQNVPDSPQLDRLLRYETSLERTFDRTLTQLERVQRMRLGQPVPPPIKVDVSSEPTSIQLK